MERVAAHDATEDLKKTWWLLFVLGAASVIIGGLLMFWPDRTLTVVTTIVGFFMIIAGVIRFLVAVFDSGSEERWLMAIAGIVGVALGVVVVRNPETTIKVVVLITGVFWLISGMVDFFRGVSNGNLPDRSLRIVFGAITALFGVVVLVWPSMTVTVFAVLTGLYIVFFGLLEIVAAFQLKNA